MFVLPLPAPWRPSVVHRGAMHGASAHADEAAAPVTRSATDRPTKATVRLAQKREACEPMRLVDVGLFCCCALCVVVSWFCGFVIVLLFDCWFGWLVGLFG